MVKYSFSLRIKEVARNFLNNIQMVRLEKVICTIFLAEIFAKTQTFMLQQHM
jgi:hypothetical protein